MHAYYLLTKSNGVQLEKSADGIEALFASVSNVILKFQKSNLSLYDRVNMKYAYGRIAITPAPLGSPERLDFKL